MTDAFPLLQIVNGEKRYGKRVILSIRDFSVRHGDLILLQGSNGSGKSTLMRILAGAIPLTRGTVHEAPELQDMRVGFAPQSGGVYDDLTVRQNLELYAGLYGVAAIGVLEEHWFIRDSALAPILDTPVSNLSGGIKKLTVLACILAIQPHGLILDEPTSELDERHARHFYSAISRLSATLSFLIMSSHEDRFAGLLSRQISLQDGRLT
jgi:ABC-type multidrug transport system ATPase subunit